MLVIVTLICIQLALALPLEAPPKPGPGAVLVQHVGSPGGASIIPPAETTPLAASEHDILPECEQDYTDLHTGETGNDYIDPNNHINNSESSPIKGLVAAETTVIVPPAKGSSRSRLVVYYQENHSRVAFTSRSTDEPTHRPLEAIPTTRSVAASPIDQEARKWLGLHNEARAQYGADQLVWSNELMEKAKRNAELCTGDHS
jgi:hypothetical protein